MLSRKPRIYSLKDKLYRIDDGYNQTGCFGLEFKCFCYETSRREFLLSASTPLPCNIALKLPTFYVYERVIDRISCIHSLCAVVATSRDKSDCSFTVFSFIDNCWKIVGNLRIPGGSFCPGLQSFVPSNLCFRIISQNCICFIFRNNLFISTLTPQKDSLELGLQSFPIEANDKTTIIWLKNYNLSTERQVTFVMLYTNHRLGVKSESSTADLCQNSIKVYALLYDTKEYICYNIDPSQFLPDIYAEITSCIDVIDCSVPSDKLTNNDGNRYDKENITSYDIDISTEVYICTSFKQLVHLKNGKVVNFVSIPFGDAERILQFEGIGGNVYLVIHSTQNLCCIVILDTFKVLEVFSDIEEVHVADFLHCGSEQLLLLPRAGSSRECQRGKDWTKHFIITDFAGTYINTCEQESDNNIRSEDHSESLNSAVHALEVRLQAGAQSLTYAERLLHRKQGLVEQSLKALQNMTLGNDERAKQQPGLVPLLEESHSCSATDTKKSIINTEVGDDSTGYLKVTDTWQRLFQNKWVVGAEVFNGMDRSTYNVHMSLVAQFQDSHNSSIANVVSCSSHYNAPTFKSCYCDTIKTKRRKLDKDSNQKEELIIKPRDSGYVMTVLSVPSFTDISNGHYLLVLHYELDPCDNGSKIVQPEVTPRQCAISCGMVELTASHVLRGSLDVNLEDTQEVVSGDVVKKNLLVMNVVQRKQCVQVKSVWSSLSQLDAALQEMGFVFLPSYDFYICKTNKHLDLVRVKFDSKESRCLVLTVYTKDESQFFLFVHGLYSQVGDDVTILPVTRSSTAEDTGHAVRCLSSELSFTSSALREIITSHQDVLPQKSCAEYSAENLETFRKNFEVQQVSLAEKGSKNCDPEKLLNFRTGLEQYEKQTDMAIRKLGHAD